MAPRLASQPRMLWLRALAVWGLLMAAETVHGALRTIYLVPAVGDFRSRQIGVATGSLLIVGIVWLLVRWLQAPDRRTQVAIGLLWVALTIGFEIVLGHFVFGFAWSRIGEDFDVRAGGLLPFGMAVLALSPLLAARLRGNPR